jgi:sec-independent protein translocase protein TatB
MNIFSNVGVTELILILLLALLVVGPERLPELGRQLAKILRDVRKAYENLTSDLGPELMSIQETTKELRESVESVRSIPKDVVSSVVKAADLDDTMKELKGVTDDVSQVGKTISTAGKVIKSPVSAAVSTARSALLSPETETPDSIAPDAKAKAVTAESEAPAVAQDGASGPLVDADVTAPELRAESSDTPSQVEADSVATATETPANNTAVEQPDE